MHGDNYMVIFNLLYKMSFTFDMKNRKIFNVVLDYSEAVDFVTDKLELFHISMWPFPVIQFALDFIKDSHFS